MSPASGLKIASNLQNNNNKKHPTIIRKQEVAGTLRSAPAPEPRLSREPRGRSGHGRRGPRLPHRPRLRPGPAPRPAPTPAGRVSAPDGPRATPRRWTHLFEAEGHGEHTDPHYAVHYVRDQPPVGGGGRGHRAGLRAREPRSEAPDTDGRLPGGGGLAGRRQGRSTSRPRQALRLPHGIVPHSLSPAASVSRRPDAEAQPETNRGHLSGSSRPPLSAHFRLPQASLPGSDGTRAGLRAHAPMRGRPGRACGADEAKAAAWPGGAGLGGPQANGKRVRASGGGARCGGGGGGGSAVQPGSRASGRFARGSGPSSLALQGLQDKVGGVRREARRLRRRAVGRVHVQRLHRDGCAGARSGPGPGAGAGGRGLLAGELRPEPVRRSGHPGLRGTRAGAGRLGDPARSTQLAGESVAPAPRVGPSEGHAGRRPAGLTSQRRRSKGHAPRGQQAWGTEGPEKSRRASRRRWLLRRAWRNRWDWRRKGLGRGENREKP